MSTDPSTELEPDRPRLPDGRTETAPDTAATQPSTADGTRHVTPEQRPTPPTAGPSFPSIPGYEIESELGRGGMGVVYKARHLELNRVVALKMILAGGHAGPNELARFKTEAEAVAGLNHPNIVQIFEVGEREGVPYFTLEFCPGGSLADQCHAGPMPARKAAVLVETVARGVAYAHAQGVVHRDLKPANVLIHNNGEPKVTDFGLAKKVDSGGDITATGAVMGTPAYMAPEQAGGMAKRVGPAADVWALGAILYRLLTGEVPFKGNSPMGTVRKVLEEEPAPPRSVVPGVPRDLEVVCLKCLSKEPGKRYVSADALADDLRRWLNGVPIRARSVGRAERAWKWLRRNPMAATAAAALLIGAVMSAVLFVWALRNADAARAERDAKEEQRRLAEANESEATAERDVAVAVREFMFRDVLGQADVTTQADRILRPGGRLAHDLTVREALDRAAANLTPEKIGDKFPDRPLTRAAVLRAVGGTYQGVGEYAEAVAFLERADDALTHVLGEGHPDVLACRHDLAVAYWSAGRPDDAIPLYERTLKQCEATLGESHTDTLTLRNNLGHAYESVGRLDEAIGLFERTLAEHEAKSGDAHPATLQSRHNLGGAYAKTGRVDEAIPLLRETLRQRLAVLGEGHPDVLASRHSLGFAYQSAGRPADAVPLYQRTLEQCEATLGEDHPYTLVARNNLAAALEGAGRLAEAIPLFERTLTQRRDKLGDDHPDTLMSLNNLAFAYRRAGRVGEAIPLYEGTLKRQEATLGADHPATLTIRGNLALAYEFAGRLGEAIELYERSYEGLKRQRFQHRDAPIIQANLIDAYEKAGAFRKQEVVLRERLTLVKAQAPPGHPVIAQTLARLGDCLLRQRNFAEAEATLRECLEARRETMPSSWLTANAESMLGEALLGQGNYAEAGELLRSGLSGMEAAFETDEAEELPPPALRTQRLLEATARLVRLSDANDSRRAAVWKARWANLCLSKWPVPLR